MVASLNLAVRATNGSWQMCKGAAPIMSLLLLLEFHGISRNFRFASLQERDIYDFSIKCLIQDQFHYNNFKCKQQFRSIILACLELSLFRAYDSTVQKPF
jgi:hypothetical protein